MINDGNNGNNGQNQQAGIVQISAKEFAAKFKSKRGEYKHAARGPIFSDGIHEWHVSLGCNFFRRETSDLISFLFHSECYSFLASECQAYIPPYGKSHLPS